MRKAALAIILLALLSSCSFRDSDGETHEKGIYPDLVLTNAEYTLGQSGERPIHLTCSMLALFSADSLAQIDNLSFISYDENGETAVEGRADRAVVDTDTKRMELEGDVVIHAASGDMMITSDALVFDSENDEITADGNVSVSSEDGSFRGTGFRGDLRAEAYAFATIDEGVFTL